jgi:hypothetical protein
MLRKLGFLVLGLSVAMSAMAADRSATISGRVQSNTGVPQMGALVEVIGSAASILRAFTDENGGYSVGGLTPGTYSVKVSAPLFLPSMRQGLGLAAGSSVVVNLTLNSLFAVVQIAPLRGNNDSDDWKWVLRSVSSRPVLRFQQSGGAASTLDAAEGSNGSGADLKGALSFVAGSSSDGFGGVSDMNTGFSLERSVFSNGLVALSGNLGSGDNLPDAVVRASYRRQVNDGSEAELALTLRRLASPDLNLTTSDFEAMALTASDRFALGDRLEFKGGSEIESIQFINRVSAARPFGSLAYHPSPDTVIEYAYATSEPATREEKGFDSAPADLSESGPRMSAANSSITLERAHHQELSFSHREGKTRLQMAVYSDRISDPALTGVGDYTSESGEVLPDIYSGTFTYRGRSLDTQGVRMVVQRDLNSRLTATADYAFGGVLDLANQNASLDSVRELTTTRYRHALTGKLKGTLPGTGTRWIVSYRWVNGEALTPVDIFNSSAGQADPYLNLFLRQRIPSMGFLPSHLEAIVDLRNLLAEGYVPVVAQDGHTVYLVQAARSFRGGLAFTF